MLPKLVNRRKAMYISAIVYNVNILTYVPKLVNKSIELNLNSNQTAA